MEKKEEERRNSYMPYAWGRRERYSGKGTFFSLQRAPVVFPSAHASERPAAWPVLLVVLLSPQVFFLDCCTAKGKQEWRP